MTILIGYDGSDDARAAVAYAGARLRPEPAVVLTVWEPLLTRSAWPLIAGRSGGQDTEEEKPGDEERHADVVAREGAELAITAGLPEAAARAERSNGPVWSTIVNVANELDVTLIVIGSRGLSEVKSVLLGSVSDRVLHHAHRPMLIVPPAEADGA